MLKILWCLFFLAFLFGCSTESHLKLKNDQKVKCYFYFEDESNHLTKDQRKDIFLETKKILEKKHNLELLDSLNLLETSKNEPKYNIYILIVKENDEEELFFDFTSFDTSVSFYIVDTSYHKIRDLCLKSVEILSLNIDDKNLIAKKEKTIKNLEDFLEDVRFFNIDDGIGRYEAEIIANHFSWNFISGCGGPDKVTETEYSYEFDVLVGIAATLSDHKIIIDKKDGAIQYGERSLRSYYHFKDAVIRAYKNYK